MLQLESVSRRVVVPGRKAVFRAAPRIALIMFTSIRHIAMTTDGSMRLGKNSKGEGI